MPFFRKISTQTLSSSPISEKTIYKDTNLYLYRLLFYFRYVCSQVVQKRQTLTVTESLSRQNQQKANLLIAIGSLSEIKHGKQGKNTVKSMKYHLKAVKYGNVYRKN